jgi:predicted amidohydrolase YtcJ
MHMAVNRVVPEEFREQLGEEATTEVFLPDERLDLAAAVRMFTMGSAFVNHLDDVTGSIEVGKFGDLAVLDRNPFDGPVSEIRDARVLLTMVEGRTVYTGDGLG